MDFDDDGLVYLEDVIQGGEECFVTAAEVAAGPGSVLAPSLQKVAAQLHKNKVRSIRLNDYSRLGGELMKSVTVQLLVYYRLLDWII